MKSLFGFVTFVSAFLLTGCTDWKAKVESDTSWSGSFSGRTVDGTGNQTIDIDDDDIVCCSVQKETEKGFLRVSIVDEGGNFLIKNGESKETTAAYGVVTVCSK